MKVLIKLSPELHPPQGTYENAHSVEVMLPGGGHLEIKRIDGETLALYHDGSDGEPECVWSHLSEGGS